MSTRPNGFNPNQTRATDGTWVKEHGTKPQTGGLVKPPSPSEMDPAFARFQQTRDELQEQYAAGEITRAEFDAGWERVKDAAPPAMTSLARRIHPDAEQVRFEMNHADGDRWLMPTEMMTSSGEIIPIGDDSDLEETAFSVTGGGYDGSTLYGMRRDEPGSDSYTFWVDAGNQQERVRELEAEHLEAVTDQDTYERHIRPLAEDHAARERLARTSDDPRVLDYLAHDHVSGVHDAALMNRNVSAGTLHSVIAGSRHRTHDPSAVNVALFHDNVAPATLRHAYDNRYGDTWESHNAQLAVQSRNCPRDVLVRAWADAGNQYAVAHENFPPEQLAKAVQNPTPRVAQNPNLTSHQLQSIVDQTAPRDSDNDDMVRESILSGVAQHRATSRTTLTQLAEDREEWVRKTASDRLRTLDTDWEKDLLGGTR